MCVELDALATAVDGAQRLPRPTGLGAADVLADQVDALATAVAVLQRELAVRMAALEAAGTPVTDVRGDAARAGVPAAQAAGLRRLGVFAAEHPELAAQWQAGAITADQLAAVAQGAGRLPTGPGRDRLVELVLPHLAGLDLRETRRLVAATVELLDPGDPDQEERRDHEHRSLVWSAFRGGIAFQGYLPDLEAGKFLAAVRAVAEAGRVEGDGITVAQRHADALLHLVDIAAAQGLPTGGGLPAAVTLSVSLDEAARVAAKDPARHGLAVDVRQRGSSTADGRLAGDAAVRFGLCCAALTPVLTDQPSPTGLLGRIAATPAEPVAVGRAVRLATTAQRKALQLRDGGCVIPGCTIGAAYTQPHHVQPWSLGGETDLENLASLCFVHHRLVELGKWTLQRRRSGDPSPHPQALAHSAWWILPRAR
jgi:hypothetical protein